MRLGLAGAGRIGAMHAEILRGLDEVDALVIADAQPQRAGEVAGKLGAEHVEDVEALFGAGLDGLVVAAATDAHPELIVRSVEAGIPVLCEKPVAGDVAETVRVLRRVTGAEVPVHVGFQRRFDPGYAAARAAVRSGELGWVHTLRATTLDPAPPPATYIPTSGGLFRDCGVHDFDVIRWVSGQEVAEVYAVGTNRGEEFFRAAGDVDTLGAVLTLADDTIALVSATRYNAAGYDVRLEVMGSRQSLAVGLDERMPLRSVEAGVAWPSGPAYPTFVERFQPAYVAELRAFVASVRGETSEACTVADALEASYVAEACELSRREHRPVRISEVRRD
ncbi:myo-inositol 2-dehydrogenase / D-chiro-inositol 1-dehydrogenase [Amycolatopsis arida]|uniref:Myo-inositol 2-dehydrogenase / D-chiro-inositol 1-dehydrogenase n=1 Tax=Amycolatopsis arida TaxID=587909 RepID=A0A1I5L097_9PSEU|nr:Gfo/Idh/MocA family oxidoreductase [Amycolatopsis arida]TDX85896.1 myo-inositol 2-dehydrogenase/D-chiro-inositol 1-dehydrogenase [Amycolatopsis arida]SFO90588.1 myo-inositol 2-dehydrogenase / D-chiro-inositol 1-dehydrogenase [Amycolatopsis arida]